MLSTPPIGPSPRPARPVAVLLAAGQGERIGAPKALLDAGGGQSFLSRLAQTCRGAGLTPLAVVGAEAERVLALHPGLAWARNAEWPRGQLSSVRVGLAAALAQGAEQLVVHPVDAPLLRADSLAAVQAALAGAPVAIACRGGKAGHPVALTAAAARAVLASSAPTLAGALAELSCARVEVDDPAVGENVNTPADYLRLFGRPVALAGAP